MRYLKPLLFLFALSVARSFCAAGQDTTRMIIVLQPTPSDLGPIEVIPYPTIRHDARSRLPDRIRVLGYAVDSISRGACSYSHSGSVIKVRLTQAIPGYPFPFVYLVTPCLPYWVRMPLPVDVYATRLMVNEQEYPYRNVANSLGVDGSPFYKLSEQETRKITMLAWPR